MSTALATKDAALPLADSAPPVNPSPVKLGYPVIYRPRVPYGRQHELFGFVTRVIDAERGTIDIVTFPANSEAVHYNSVARFDGDKIKLHCWEPVNVDAVGEDRFKAIVDVSLKPFADEVNRLRDIIADCQKQMAECVGLKQRVVMLEKRAAKES